MIPRRFTGIAVRNIAATHLKAIAFAIFVLWTVAVAIDLTKNLDEVREMASAQGLMLFPLVAEYLLYRSADIAARMLPMACLIGGFIAELLRHQRMENVILAAAGARPTLLFAALLGTGLVTGSLQFALEGWLRPAAVFAQTDLGLGSYARRFRQGDTGKHWFVSGDRAIEARVIRNESPELLDLRIFVGIGEMALERIVTADRALPTQEPLIWMLENVVVWEGPPRQGDASDYYGAIENPPAFFKNPSSVSQYIRVLFA